MDFHDPVSSLSHLIMAGWAFLGSIFLLRLARHHSRSQRISLVFYAITVVSLYASSGLFHGLQHGSAESRRVWQLLDQTAIFGLILGSNVPVIVYILRGRLRNYLLMLMSAIALTGIFALWVLPVPPHELLVAVYLAMGLLGLAPIRLYFRRLGWRGMKWVFLLSFFYVAGGVSEALEWPVIVTGWFTYHEVLHFCDIAGTIAHYALLLQIITTTPPKHARNPRGQAGRPVDFRLTAPESRATL